MTALSLRGPAPDCVPADVDSDTAELGYGGYTTAGNAWGGSGADALWTEAGDMLLTDDFDLSSIPPVELGTTLPDQNGFDGDEPPYLNGGEHDPFAGLFAGYAPGEGAAQGW